MAFLTKTAFLATLALALAFTFSCSSDNGNEPGPQPPVSSGGNGGVDGSSSSVTANSGNSSSSSATSGGGSSSSATASSGSSSSGGSTQANIVYGPDVPYDGGPYKTVVIGGKTWFQRNLNYAATGSKCGNDYGTLGDANTATCDTYGRLYDWATAMNIDKRYNNELWGNDYNHRGICPSGWHIPSDAEWSELTNYVESYFGCSSCAARYLKARSGWYGGGNGEDAFGFSALPGGLSDSDGYFNYVGYHGYWWSASEYGSFSASIRGMGYGYEGVYWNYDDKDLLFSVRCLQD